MKQKATVIELAVALGQLHSNCLSALRKANGFFEGEEVVLRDLNQKRTVGTVLDPEVEGKVLVYWGDRRVENGEWGLYQPRELVKANSPRYVDCGNCCNRLCHLECRMHDLP